MIALLLVALSLSLSNFAATIGIGVTGVDATARLPVGLILGHNLASALKARHRCAGVGLLIAIDGYRRQRCPPTALTLAP